MLLILVGIIIMGCTIPVSVEEELPESEITANGITTNEMIQEPEEGKEEISSENILQGDSSVKTPEITAMSQSIINGKTTAQRLEEAIAKLHQPGSGEHIRQNFPDIKLVYTDPGDSSLPQEILPFEYYYSKEASVTFNICAPDLTIFVCDGKLDRKITEQDINSGHCTVTPIYRPILGGLR